MKARTIGAMIGLVCALTTGCATQSGSDVPDPGPAAGSDTPENTVRRYFDAYNAGDVDGMNATSCSSGQRSEATAPAFATVVSDISTPTVAGETATVLVTMYIDSGSNSNSVPSRVPIFLTNEAGHWGFCMFERPSS